MQKNHPNVNSVERAFEEGHLTNETSKEEIENYKAFIKFV